MKKQILLLCAASLVMPACDGGPANVQEAGAIAETDLSSAEVWVTDAADIIGEKFEERLTEQLRELQSDLGHQMVVVTVPTLNGQSIEEYTISLARSRGDGGGASIMMVSWCW